MKNLQLNKQSVVETMLPFHVVCFWLTPDCVFKESERNLSDAFSLADLWLVVPQGPLSLC